MCMFCRHWSFVSIAGLVVAVAAPLAAAPIATSTFDAGDEGWTVVTTLGYQGPPQYSSTGGNPDGFIYAVDPDTGAWGFAAPATFLGPVSEAYGQTFSFDIAAYYDPEYVSGWVGIEGAGYQFVCLFDAPATTYPDWHGRTVWMTETAGWVDPDTGLPPTSTQMMAVLSNLEGLVITAEFVEGLEDDISGLDNVVLMPEPGTLALLGLGVVMVLKRRGA
ncbi:MAG: PEP-CTERM sorting domain-containing protein [Phycisphaerae bacterium]|nr:PEP-CTERM sorting domain-containing protein [Phycisphaerae bacterium]